MTRRPHPSAHPSIARVAEQLAARHPVHATAMGVRFHDHELPDWSREGRDDEQDEFEALTVAIRDEHPDGTDDGEAFTPTGSPEDPTWIDALHAMASMDARQLAFESAFFADRNPVLWLREALAGVQLLMAHPTPSAEDDLASLAMRLHEVPRFLAAMQETVRQPVPSAWCDLARTVARQGESLQRDLIVPWLAARRMAPDAGSWLEEAAGVAAAAFREAGQWLDDVTTSAESPALGAEGFAALLQAGHLVPEPLDALEESLVRAQQLQQEMGVTSWDDEEESSGAGATWPIPWLASVSDAMLSDPMRSASGIARREDAGASRLPIPEAGSVLTLLGAQAAADWHLTSNALPGAWLRDAWALHQTLPAESFESSAWDDPQGADAGLPALLITTALLDLRLHTGAIMFEEAVQLLESEGGVMTDPATAHRTAAELSMQPGRALMAWYGARTLHQLRCRAVSRSGQGLSTTDFAAQLFRWGALPSPLLARLLA